MRKILLALPFIAASLFSSCSKDVTAPENGNDKEQINPTEFVADYFSSKERFLSVDSVKVKDEDVSIYGDFIDPYNETTRDSTYSNGEIVTVKVTKTPRVSHINVDIGEKNMTDSAPIFYLGTLTPRKEFLDVFYTIFSRRNDGPDGLQWFGNYYWNTVENNINRQDTSIPIFPIKIQ